ncbi:hypothetical protein VN97_g3824 [Penicillium thymicola]|uniref:Uncharacterized protein n=1 Tax=Penicillium thymicola TaxID=293382 RepID=A0AAI9TLE5_PENTH|nr:hypothetical protein VN97_g3824 [Penicillium thymicola]
MNGLGVGGSLSPDLVNTANALLYALMTLTCFAGPLITNAIGFRWTLTLGSLGYSLYAAGLYLNNRTGATWLVYLGCVTCGISAGFFWSVEGAVATGYPEQHKRGRYIRAPRGIHWREELCEMWRLARSRSILLLVPLFWYFGWIQAYPGTYLATYFTVRSRALGSFMTAVVGTLATWLGGSLVDLPWLKNRKHRAIVTFAVIALMNNAIWIWAVIIQNEHRHTNPVLDWGNQRSFGRGFGLYLFERISFRLVENYIYWCIGNLSGSPGDQIRYRSLLRGIKTAGVAVGFGVQAVPTALYCDSEYQSRPVVHRLTFQLSCHSPSR